MLAGICRCIATDCVERASSMIRACQGCVQQVAGGREEGLEDRNYKHNPVTYFLAVMITVHRILAVMYERRGQLDINAVYKIWEE